MNTDTTNGQTTGTQPTDAEATSAEPTNTEAAEPQSDLPLREQIADFLRRELIGPDPRPTKAQANGEEVLVGDAPRMRYGAGVLFPQTARIDDALIATDEEVAQNQIGGAEVGGDENGAAEAGHDARADREDELADGSSGTSGNATRADKERDEPDEMVSLSNAFLPAAMGFSCLAQIGEAGLVARVSAATYRSREVDYVGKDGKTYSTTHWDRLPFETDVVLPASELIGADVVNPSFEVTREGAPEHLCLRVLSRPFDAGDPTLRLLTLALINAHESEDGERIANEKCFFQVEMSLRAADGSAPFREYPDATLIPEEEEEEEEHSEEDSLALLYRHRKTYGIGHGCAAAWDGTDLENGRAGVVRCDVMPVHEIKPIVPRTFKELPLRMFDLSDRGDDGAIDPLLNGLCDRYEEWIGGQEAQAQGLDLPKGMRKAADHHLKKCRECLARMRGGAALLRENAEVRRAFRLANRAMLQQQLHYALGTVAELKRPWSADENQNWTIAPLTWPDIENPGKKGSWYPFQLAFLLINLRSLAIQDDEERAIVDLIWFPTGGGKTEAYLGLTAFTIVLRRLRFPDDAGTSVLMRYTLRLLTAQQFQRAASLICALEKMRRDKDIPGDAIISAGLWAGGGLTPNSRTNATQALQKMQNGEGRDNPFVMPGCPWCGAPMGPVESNGHNKVIGYERNNSGGGEATVIFRCEYANCDFGGKHCLPLCVIDEDLYLTPPTLLLGTVDKFATLPWRPQARAFFGLERDGHEDGDEAPDLIIQDELHLISGPLGSMVGHYETVIAELCAFTNDKEQVIHPKIVASTATISRAGAQCDALWNCGIKNVFQFPPQMLRAGDSFFAREDEEAAGRCYLGVHASALGSHVTAQVRVMAALLQAPLWAQVGAPAERDPYWTLVGYYNSLRELGHAATLLGADISEYLNAMWLRLGIKKPDDHTQPERRRYVNHKIELTSRVPGGEIPELLQRLFTAYTGEREARPVDVALATNMISVGVDVPRLGLMTVAGQPKTTSEYIQATSRVGRDKPGLVVTIYNTGKPRDRSHYEHFHSYHGAVYRAVEPTSVTPFSSPVRDRALHALIATLVRYLGADENRNSPSPAPDDETWDMVRAVIEERVSGVDAPERDATMRQLEEEIDHWRRVAPPRYGDWGKPDVTVPLMYPAGSVPSREWEGKSWATQSSMRDVDASCEAHVLGSYPRPPKSMSGDGDKSTVTATEDTTRTDDTSQNESSGANR